MFTSNGLLFWHIRLSHKLFVILFLQSRCNDEVKSKHKLSALEFSSFSPPRPLFKIVDWRGPHVSRDLSELVRNGNILKVNHIFFSHYWDNKLWRCLKKSAMVQCKKRKDMHSELCLSWWENVLLASLAYFCKLLAT